MVKINFSRFINKLSKARQPSPLRAVSEIILECPGMKSLSVGLPNPATFPITSFSLQGRDKSLSEMNFYGQELDKCFQYTVTKGYPDMLKWVEKLTNQYHKPPILLQDCNVKWDAIITTGCEDGLCKIIEMLVSNGDNVLVQNPAYPGVTSKLQPITDNLIAVESDNNGIIPYSLYKSLSKWKPSDARNNHSTIPKVLYTVPNASNPTGSTATTSRKQQVYELAQEYDLIIIEDDAYYFLQYDGPQNKSYHELDTDGRVLRLDTMSKVIGGGLRLGWVVGAEPFITRILLHQQVSTLQASSLSQMIAIRLFDDWETSGEGFEKHLHYIRNVYKSQRDLLIKCAEKHLPGLAKWNAPEGGMFLWMKVLGLEDTTDLIYKRARSKNIMMMPGSAFELQRDAKSQYLRLSYSFETEENMDEILCKLAACIREEIAENGRTR